MVGMASAIGGLAEDIVKDDDAGPGSRACWDAEIGGEAMPGGGDGDVGQKGELAFSSRRGVTVYLRGSGRATASREQQTGRRRPHEDRHVSDGAVSVPVDRREDRGFVGLAWRDARPTPICAGPIEPHEDEPIQHAALEQLVRAAVAMNASRASGRSCHKPGR